MHRIKLTVLLIIASWTAQAEIVSSSETHYVLRHEAQSRLTADEVWQRLIEPSAWWHPEHTYSGDAGNLTLDLRPGGLWLERWDGGSVAHGEVLLVVDGTSLRLNAPFGPLQGVGAYTIWTITISDDTAGAKIVFEETATAPPGAKLHELAPAVDFVKSEAIRRLSAH